jgi:hypothetical protein
MVKRLNSDTTLDAGKSHAAMLANAPFGMGRIALRAYSCLSGRRKNKSFKLFI